MIRALAVASTLLLTGGAHAADRKAPQILTMEKGSSLVTTPNRSQAVYTGSRHGGSLIITDPRTMKTIAVIPKEKK